MFTTRQYGIWCRVTGGVTGTREAWLKSEGTPHLWTDRATSAAEAERLNKVMNSHPHRTTYFQYRVEEY